ncbi:hypothetical protein QNH39_18025 [Neobacillus novalis]|uniref:Uncharacterized protein n=1 Tax=Neobacillus novalis TaxID=220687 RepID=A0AA95MNV2_9BACI|nr:hypothetical protein [Neobacillus novalis]WHY84546.1 hypothetical protein QNH39_18025 [Neobacillus novalis]
MELVRIYKIKELAQEFNESPKIQTRGRDVILSYDYEQDTGEYAWKSIIFVETIAYRVSKMSCVGEDVLKSYNSISEVKYSQWLNEIKASYRGSQKFEYKHYLIFFDEYGTYEFIAKNLIVDSGNRS